MDFDAVKKMLENRQIEYLELKDKVLMIAERKKKIGISANDKGCFEYAGIFWETVRYNGYDFYRPINPQPKGTTRRSLKSYRTLGTVYNFTPYSAQLQKRSRERVKKYILENRHLLSDYPRAKNQTDSAGRG